MLKRVLILVAMAVAVVFVFTRGNGGDTASQNEASPSAEATRAPSAAATPKSPSPTPQDAATAYLTAMQSEIVKPHTMHVQFNGSDASGTLTFDVVTDGQGHLAGTYSRQGFAAQIVVVSNVLYMRGTDAVASYTGIPASQLPSAEWYRIPPWAGAGILGTLSDSGKLGACIRISVPTNDTYKPVAPSPIASDTTVVFARVDADTNVDWPWQFAMVRGTSRLAAWNLLGSGTYHQPADCNNGVTDPGGPPSGATGTFTFSAWDQPIPAITAPVGAVTAQLPSDDPPPKS